LGAESFEDDNIISVVIPASVKKIDYRAFAKCEHLTTVTIKGKSVIIGPLAFTRCSNLGNLVFQNGALIPQKSENGNYYSIYGNNASTIHGATAFEGCKALPRPTRLTLLNLGFPPDEILSNKFREEARGH
jgi:hypothetical protein